MSYEPYFFEGIDKLRRANDYLRFSIGIDTPPPDAKARFDARAIICRLEMEVLDDLELAFSRADTKGEGL